MKRIVTIDDVTGNVVSQWSGGDEQILAPVAGRSHVALQVGDTADYSRKRWNGSAFIDIPPAPVRVISPVDFARRFTLAEEAAIDTLADTNRIVKIWRYRLTLAQRVDLDHADVAAGLAYIKSVGIPSVWADAATADQRIRDIRANG